MAPPKVIEHEPQGPGSFRSDARNRSHVAAAVIGMEANINILEFGLVIVVALAVGVAIALVLMRRRDAKEAARQQRGRRDTLK